MGICGSKDATKANVDKAVDAAAGSKDKIVTGIKDNAAKAGVSQSAADTAATKVDAALSDKEGLKAQVNSALGTSTDAAPAAAAEAVAEAK